jgi:hypothetical protein
MILRLFLVPALIVGVLVGLFLLGPGLYGWVNRLLGRSSADARSAEQFLRDLDNSNPEVRWRAASDLAQVLLRKDALASDVPFTLHLADRLHTAVAQSAEAERENASRFEGLTAGEKARELKKLEPDRNLIIYLGASLGNCMIPVGAPLLKQLAVQESGMEPEALAERRRRALFALATLGENLKRFDRLSDREKTAIEEKLQEAAEQGGHSRLTRETLDYLRKRRQGKSDTLGVAEVLKKCSTDLDPFLRELSALASNFWTGTALEDAVVEEFLVKLSHDAGAGEDRLEERLGRNPNSSRTRAVTTKKGFKVQANATIALARRGSPRVRLDLLSLMLEPDRLREVFVVRSRTAADKPDESMVVLTLTDTLKALARLRARRPEMDLDRFGPLVDDLTKNDNPAVRTEAQQTQLALRKAG